MTKPDQIVNICLIALIIIHMAVWAVGFFTHRLSYLFAFLNSLVAILITGYWALNEMHIRQHTIEGREIIVLAFEALVVISGACTILFGYNLKIIQYIIFGIHFISLLAGLIFMLTFKINRLF